MSWKTGVDCASHSSGSGPPNTSAGPPISVVHEVQSVRKASSGSSEVDSCVGSDVLVRFSVPSKVGCASFGGGGFDCEQPATRRQARTAKTNLNAIYNSLGHFTPEPILTVTPLSEVPTPNPRPSSPVSSS